jgi:hypothetical protein
MFGSLQVFGLLDGGTVGSVILRGHGGVIDKYNGDFHSSP